MKTPGDNVSYGQLCLCTRPAKCRRSSQTRWRQRQKPSLFTQIPTGGRPSLCCAGHTHSVKERPQRTHQQCARKDKTGSGSRRGERKAERLPAASLCSSVCSACKQERGRLGWGTVKGQHCGLRYKYRLQKNSTAFKIVPAHFLILHSLRGWILHLSCWSEPGDGELRPPLPPPHSLRTAAMDGVLLTLLHPARSKAEHWDC